MFYGSVPPSYGSTSSQYQVSFDSMSEKFNENFPIILQQRVHPQNFSETMNHCSKIMKEHMDKIQTSKWMGLVVFLVVFICTLLLTGIPLTVYFLVYANSSSSSDPTGGIWVWILFPILYVAFIVLIIFWSVRRRRQIMSAHAQCKTALTNYLEHENQTIYNRTGAQLVLRYDTRIIMSNRYTVALTYKYLMVLPCIDIYLAGTTPVVVNQIQPVVQQPIVTQPVTYDPNAYNGGYQATVYTQPTQQYEKVDNPNQPLL